MLVKDVNVINSNKPFDQSDCTQIIIPNGLNVIEVSTHVVLSRSIGKALRLPIFSDVSFPKFVPVLDVRPDNH